MKKTIYVRTLPETPLDAGCKNIRRNNPRFNAEESGRVVLERVVDVRRKTNAGDFFKIMI